MHVGGSFTGVRRTYNQWVANETLEDFALRFTARRARKWSAGRVANTAIGSISFLALEAIGGALTLAYGFDNALAAILFAGLILFLTGLPISYHAAKAGVDIDLLTRGAGFGYLGSTVTSLIYAGFTFIFFALEAAILSKALELCFGLPISVGYIVNALLVIPLVTHGFARIGLFQTWSQPLWIMLHVAPLLAMAASGLDISFWTNHVGRLETGGMQIDIVLVASATGIALSLIAQIGEQVDFLRFLPEPKTPGEKRSWWAALLAAGPGWAVFGTAKMLVGSFLAVMVLESGVSPSDAVEPTRMYLAAFEFIATPEAALLLTAAFVILSQLKINVTNAYAGSIAWSNFFSRLTHSHPGRVVWLVFNVTIALLLMEFGIFGALESILAAYSHVALAWLGAVTADLVINMPLGLRPKRIEFRRGKLYDINPVGSGAMLLATIGSFTMWFGVFGTEAAAFSSLSALAIALVTAPLIAVATKGRYYLARQPEPIGDGTPAEITCSICENHFDPEDMINCPFHAGKVCSLCCSLESRCDDACKPHGRVEYMLRSLADRYLPEPLKPAVMSRFGAFMLSGGIFAFLVGAILLVVNRSIQLNVPEASPAVGHALTLAFGLLSILVGVVAWLFTLSNESRDLAERELEQQNRRLLEEMRAHERTDKALQRAKEAAESANEAKSRYLVGITHELRTPLNAILGYAQLLENDPLVPRHRTTGVRIIRRSSEHMADLIEGLLDVSKIEAGRLDIYRDEIALREMLEQLSAIFSMEAREKGLEFRDDISRSVPDFVWGDEKRLRQILINLLSNAIRYTKTGEVGLAFSYRNETAKITVWDTGRGIPEEDRERIFSPFERIEDPLEPTPGTGLGLTITKLLVEILGGELRLDSTVGEGSKFEILLYLTRSDRSGSSKRERQRLGYTGPIRHILVCDDNAEHRRLVEDILAPLGFQLSMAESGVIALKLCETSPPDLALIDAAMPGMSGIELCCKLRTELNLPIPLIIVSAHAEADPEESGRAIHCDAYLSKPIGVEALLDHIGASLGLDWVYEQLQHGPDVRPAAPAETLDALDAALSIGHFSGVKRTVDAMQPETAEATAFVERAQSYLEQVDLQGLQQLVRDTRNEL